MQTGYVLLLKEQMFVNHLTQEFCDRSELINNIIEEQTIITTETKMVFTHRLIEIAV